MEVFRAPITTKLDSGPRPSGGSATRGSPVAIVPRNAQANAIRLGLAARLPRSCRRVFHMLQVETEIQGSPRKLKSPGRYLDESISKPFSCPAMDDPRHSGSVAKLLRSATPIPDKDGQGPEPSQKSAAFRKDFAMSSATEVSDLEQGPKRSP